MKLYYVGIINNETRPVHELVAEKDVSDFGFFTRNTYGEFMTLFAKNMAEKTKAGTWTHGVEQDYVFHARARPEGVCGVVICDNDYPQDAAQELLLEVLDKFLAGHPRSSFITSNPKLTFPELKEYMVKYSDPTMLSNIQNVKNTLEETKRVVREVIVALGDRGEKLEDMVAKSNDLSAQSKKFYIQAKKQNSCCIVM